MSWWGVLVLLLFMVITTSLSVIEAQQGYVNNKQLNCTNKDNSTFGNICNSQPSCQSYLTFRSLPPQYNTPTSISYLLNSAPSLIAQSNNITDVQPIPADTLITIPITCSCSGNYYQHNASYTLKTLGETYFTIANNTYQALTTCQSLIAQNPYGTSDLVVGLNLTVPLRCACPTKKQLDDGYNYLLTYLVSQGESVSSIADIFGIDVNTLNDANNLSSNSTVYYFTPLSVPLKQKPPTKISTTPSPTESPPPPSSTSPGDGGSGSTTKWVIVGVAVGVVLLLLVGLSLYFLCFRRRKHSPELLPATVKTSSDSFSTKKISEITPTTQSWSMSSEGLRYAVESLTLYNFEDLRKATLFFSEENKIKESVYKASFKGDDAAVKILKGDVSSEINILKRINHANIIRLSGFCVHKGNTYLVYEFAENGSLDDWLHSDKKYQNSMSLSWIQRVQIAHDIADALNYLHNYANPPHVHKNLKSGSVLLDGSFRVKVSNFGLARVMENDEGFQLTRHVMGTQGYMAPEYIENGLITPKMDVFAFGVVILELLSGREVTGGGEEKKLLSLTVSEVLEGENDREKFRGFMDPTLRDEYPLDLAYSMAEIAKRCVASDLNSRPNISEVFMVLSKIQSSSLDWDPSDDLQRSGSVSQISESR